MLQTLKKTISHANDPYVYNCPSVAFGRDRVKARPLTRHLIMLFNDLRYLLYCTRKHYIIHGSFIHTSIGIFCLFEKFYTIYFYLYFSNSMIPTLFTIKLVSQHIAQFSYFFYNSTFLCNLFYAFVFFLNLRSQVFIKIARYTGTTMPV